MKCECCNNVEQFFLIKKINNLWDFKNKWYFHGNIRTLIIDEKGINQILEESTRHSKLAKYMYVSYIDFPNQIYLAIL